MNSLRTNFKLPADHVIKITPYWLIGFIEGDGSFSVEKTNGYPLRLVVIQAITDRMVIEAIQIFLINLRPRALALI